MSESQTSWITKQIKCWNWNANFVKIIENDYNCFVVFVVFVYTYFSQSSCAHSKSPINFFYNDTGKKLRDVSSWTEITGAHGCERKRQRTEIVRLTIGVALCCCTVDVGDGDFFACSGFVFLSIQLSCSLLCHLAVLFHLVCILLATDAVSKVLYSVLVSLILHLIQSN